LPDHAAESIVEALERLQNDDLVSVWENAPGGPSVVLTTLGADRLGLELDDSGKLGQMAWVRVGSITCIRTKTLQPKDEEIGELLRAQPDPHLPATTLDGLIVLEERERRIPQTRPKGKGTRTDYNLDRPSIEGFRCSTVLGIGYVGWTPSVERKPTDGRTCRICGGQTLRKSRACLACLQSGIDFLLPKVKPPRLHHVVNDGLKGGVGAA
jgi:hypothetical protein